MRVSATGIALMHHFEGCRLKAYPDPKTGGAPWTIGWGHTGKDVYPGLVWTQEQADHVFAQVDLPRFEDDVNELVTSLVTQGQFDALVSFAYNCGSDIDADTKAEGLGDSTLLKYVNTGRYMLAADELLKWISRGTPAEKGLRNRRAAERALFLGEDWMKIAGVRP